MPTRTADYDPLMDELPPDLAAQYKAEKRRQKMAEMLSGQAMQPLQAPEVKGRFQGAISPFEGLAKLAQAYMASKGLEGSDARMADIAKQNQNLQSEAVARYKKNTVGTPEMPMGPPTEEGSMGVQPAIVPTPEQRAAAITEAITANNARLNKMGALDFARDTKKEDRIQQGIDRLDQIEAAAREGRITRESAAAASADLRRELQSNLFAQQRSMAQLVAGLKPAPTGNNKPPSGYRYTPDGDLEAIPGGPADSKLKEKEQQKSAGETGVNTTLTLLRDAYNRLEKGGGVTSTKKGILDNAGAWLSSSTIGQGAGKIFGTQNQSARNDIAMARPALLAALMKATGMSSRQMDSNAELKLWLSTATDPTLDVESNRRALDNIEKRYLTPGAFSAPVDSGGLSPQEQSELDQLRKRFNKK